MLLIFICYREAIFEGGVNKSVHFCHKGQCLQGVVRGVPMSSASLIKCWLYITDGSQCSTSVFQCEVEIKYSLVKSLNHYQKLKITLRPIVTKKYNWVYAFVFQGKRVVLPYSSSPIFFSLFTLSKLIKNSRKVLFMWITTMNIYIRNQNGGLRKKPIDSLKNSNDGGA